MIVKLPTLADEPLAISKSIVASKNYDDEVAWKNGGVVAILDYFGGAISRKNQALTSTSGLAGFDAIDSIGAEELVRVVQQIALLFSAALARRGSVMRQESQSRIDIKLPFAAAR